MIAEAILCAALLHRPLPLVDLVYGVGGLDAVALVECESQFNPNALRVEPRGHTSYGLFQLDSEWHDQLRGNLQAHVYAGVLFLTLCKMKTNDELAGAVELYNGSRSWGYTVQKKRESLALYLWRHLR